jgi:4-hydroxybenzoyl-CoA thioesterase
VLTNIRPHRIEWCDCDPAGIVFYPRYFEMFDTSTTLLIERALGLSKYDYLKTYDFFGHPLVETRARFLVPTRFGDAVTIESSVSEIGRSSFKIVHRLMKGAALAVEGFETRVWVVRRPDQPAHMKAQPIPADVLARFGATESAQ